MGSRAHATVFADSTGPYHLLRRLVRKEMSELFLARSLQSEAFGQSFVIKRLLSFLAHDNAHTAIFLSEAELMKQLQHPNIVNVFDMGSRAPDYAMVMELIDGWDLEHVIRESSTTNLVIPTGCIALCMAKVCEGLSFTHALEDVYGAPRGIIHRNISPSKIMIDRNGSVKILGFGTPKSVDDRQPTRSGELKSRCQYLSPEQVTGNPVDARADIFSVGAVLYELLTGTSPFERGDTVQTLQAIVEASPRPCQALNPRVPCQLITIVETCLKKSASQRYPNALVVQQALEEAYHSHTCDDSSLSHWLMKVMPQKFALPTNSGHQTAGDDGTREPRSLPAHIKVLQGPQEFSSASMSTHHSIPTLYATSEVLQSLPRPKEASNDIKSAVTTIRHLPLTKADRCEDDGHAVVLPRAHGLRPMEDQAYRREDDDRTVRTPGHVLPVDVQGEGTDVDTTATSTERTPALENYSADHKSEGMVVTTNSAPSLGPDETSDDAEATVVASDRLLSLEISEVGREGEKTVNVTDRVPSLEANEADLKGETAINESGDLEGEATVATTDYFPSLATDGEGHEMEVSGSVTEAYFSWPEEEDERADEALFSTEIDITRHKLITTIDQTPKSTLSNSASIDSDPSPHRERSSAPTSDHTQRGILSDPSSLDSYEWSHSERGPAPGDIFLRPGISLSIKQANPPLPPPDGETLLAVIAKAEQASALEGLAAPPAPESREVVIEFPKREAQASATPQHVDPWQTPPGARHSSIASTIFDGSERLRKSSVQTVVPRSLIGDESLLFAPDPNELDQNKESTKSSACVLMATQTILVAMAVCAFSLVVYYLIPVLYPEHPTLMIHSKPTGAIVRVNGMVQSDRTPLMLSDLIEGIPYDVVIELEGYESKDIRNVQLSSGQVSTLKVELIPN
ncbi:MAG: protein kinase [Myxococcales bacterium]|nr:protein kinase [Myxococcales bacterium]